MASRPLPVCLRCGWHALIGHDQHCSPVAGAAADRLAAELSHIPSTKLGYGDRCLTFNFGENRAITFHFDPKGMPSFQRLHWLDLVNGPDAARLVEALSEVADPLEHSCGDEIEERYPRNSDAPDGEKWTCSCGKVYEHVCDEAEGCTWSIVEPRKKSA